MNKKEKRKLSKMNVQMNAQFNLILNQVLGGKTLKQHARERTKTLKKT